MFGNNQSIEGVICYRKSLPDRSRFGKELGIYAHYRWNETLSAIKSLYVDQEASLHLLRERKERAQRKERKQSLKALGEATDDSIRNDEMNRVGGSWDTNGYFGARGEIKLLEELKNVCNRLVQDHDVKLSNSLMFSMVEAHISE